jgi:hypothetical protein
MKPYCSIHVGLPKTATTMLQAHLFPCHSQIEYLGKFTEQRGEFRDAAVRAVIMNTIRGNVFDADVDRFRRQFSQSIAPTFRTGRVPLWSSEDLTVGGERRRRAKAENLRAVFGDCRVIIALRHPLRLVESLYLHLLKAHHVGTGWRLGAPPRYFAVDDWLHEHWRRPEKGALAHLDYARTIEILADVFGKEAVGVFLFEHLVEDAHRFVESLCRFVGVDAEEGVRLAAGKRANDRLTILELNRIKAMEKSSLQSTLFRFAPKALRERMLGTRRANQGGGAQAPLPMTWRERLAEMTRPGNRWLMEQWDLPLDRYEYPI